ncbi:MAG: hypothetical protein J07HX5_01160 [halophilic archaeon J07HX5]|nr:MAG: hypothetical protein J07HX5_01160 [halophilic archaeon J07HX5]
MPQNTPSLTRRTPISRRRLLAATGSISLGALAGCIGGGTDGTAGDDATDSQDTTWQTTTLTDVLTGRSFSIAELTGPVAIQSFAVWCPKCERQSREMANLNGPVTAVSLNTDPNEDAQQVREHAETNGFDWRFAVAPTEMTDSLIAEFGPAIVSAPSTPMIVACGDGKATFFSGSQQSVTELQSAATECS